MCTSEDGLAYILGAPFIDDVMNYNSLTTLSKREIVSERDGLIYSIILMDE